MMTEVLVDTASAKLAPKQTLAAEPVAVADVDVGGVIIDTIGNDNMEYIDGAEMPIIDDMPIDEGGKGFKIPNGVIIGIVLAICVGVGIFLGIKAGKRAANK